MKFATIFSAIFALIQAAKVDYKKNGADWPGKYPGCKGANQSPIDLKTDAKKVNAKIDDAFFHYERVESTPVKFVTDKSTNYVTVDANAGKANAKGFSYFESQFGKKTWSAPSQFQAEQFHFHTGSEHTVDGKRFDLEMHTVNHIPNGVTKNGYAAAALGIIFDTKNYDKSVTKKQKEVINKFFKQLNFASKTNPTPSVISYGELISALDTTNRWVYKGSVTTPTCGRLVYWNVLRKVYPISEEHFKAYRDVQLPRNTGQDIKKTGNYREIQKIDGHDLTIVEIMEDSQRYMRVIVAISVILAILLIISVILCVCIWKKNKQIEQKEAKVSSGLNDQSEDKGLVQMKDVESKN